DGIRDRNVTGVQTCALPISRKNYNTFWRPGMIKSIDLTKELTDAKAFGETAVQRGQAMGLALPFVLKEHFTDFQLIKGDKGILKIGRASCRERVYIWILQER